MQTLNIVAKELFNKIRGRFPSVTIGDGEGNVTTTPEQARFYDFDFITEGRAVGKISISLDEKGVSVVYNQGLVTNEDSLTKESWYNFLKELRQFAKKRMLNFDTRDINKSNLNRRDYKFLANNRTEEETMSEGKLYGTSRLSYQDFDGARLVLRHNQAVNQERAAGRTQNVESIYIESAEGERFKYPYKHINGARAMARHVAEGGNAYDEFGKHIVGLSEELSKLKKFKSYMSRSNVMAEGLSGYVDVVKERLTTVKKTVESLQKKAYYTEAFESFEKTEVKEVPQDVAENWIDELTIRQFNEELKDVFPYIYNLVSENTRATTLGPMDLEGYEVYQGDMRESDEEVEESGLQLSKEEMEIESAFEEMMGQFAEGDMKWKQTSMSPEEAVAKYGKEHVKVKKGGLRNGDDMVSVHVADESFDPSSEPSKADAMADEFMSAYEKGGEEALAKAMGMSDQELDQEITEYGMEHGLHADDDRDDIIQGVIEQIVDNMDEGLTDDTNEGIDKDALQAWYSKYEGKRSYDAYDLANGYFKYYLDSGIPTDAMEKGECAALIKKFGEDEFMDDPFGAMYKAPELAPISNALHSEFAKVVGKQAPDEEDVEKAADMIDNTDEGNALEKDEKTPLGEFILSYFDRENGQFPKGETAVLTMVEKDYGEKFITPAKQFIEMINNKVAEVMGYKETEEPQEIARIRELSGL